MQSSMHLLNKLKYAVFLSLLILAGTAQAKSEIYTPWNSNVAVSGYDTVAYFTQNKPIKGNKNYTTQYKGADWHFSSQANLDKFKKDPTKYAPQYGGHCAYALAAKNKLIKADPTQWNIYNGKLYINYNAKANALWNKDKAGYVAKSEKNWQQFLNKN